MIRRDKKVSLLQSLPLVYSVEFNDIMSLMGPFVLRTFDAGKGQAVKDRQLAAGSPVLAILILILMNRYIGSKQVWL